VVYQRKAGGNVSGIKSPIDDALSAAIYGRLCSVVYSALNDARENSEEPTRFRKYWDGIGAYELAKALVFSASHDRSTHPQAFSMNPWIAHHLRKLSADEIAAVVMDWLERKPLDSHVSDNPLVEDAQVHRLLELRAGLNRGS
jgi:hypothetical protein